MLTMFGAQVIRTHTRFVQDVKYSPNGDYFASVGSDGKMFLYDGKEGSTVGEVEASRGSVVSPGKPMANDSGVQSMMLMWILGMGCVVRGISWQSRGTEILSGCRRVRRMEPLRSVSLHDSQPMLRLAA